MFYIMEREVLGKNKKWHDLTIEPMINSGNYETKILNDGWTAVTKDKSLSAQFEHTVGITRGYDIYSVKIIKVIIFMIERYSRKEIKSIWEDFNKYSIWLEIELAAQAMEKLKLFKRCCEKS